MNYIQQTSTYNSLPQTCEAPQQFVTLKSDAEMVYEYASKIIAQADLLKEALFGADNCTQQPNVAVGSGGSVQSTLKSALLTLTTANVVLSDVLQRVFVGR